jgi:hypothetical protein
LIIQKYLNIYHQRYVTAVNGIIIANRRPFISPGTDRLESGQQDGTDIC